MLIHEYRCARLKSMTVAPNLKSTRDLKSMIESPNYCRDYCERTSATRACMARQRSHLASNNAMQDDLLDALHWAFDWCSSVITKVNHPSISILSVFFRHRRTSRMWGDTHYGYIRDLKNQTIIGHDLYTSSSHWGVCPRTTAESYHINPGLHKVNAGFPLKPVLFAQPLLWGPYLRAGLSVQARSDSVYKLYCGRSIALSLAGASIRLRLTQLTYQLSSAIWGLVTPSFLLSRTPTQSNLTSFGSPPTLGLDPPET